ncbi:MAG: preprotein translocase subunit SecE [Planctomycetota bacterium]|nr:MAG: preprotein translocase subunit SecE [Planctomycetota bacterium]
MPEKKGLLAVYKHGQGLWTRVTFAVALGIFLLWFLVELDGAFESEVVLMEGTVTVLDSKKSTRRLTEEDIASLEEYEKYGPLNIMVRIREKGDDRPLVEIKEEPVGSTGDLRAALAEGKSVYLYDDVVIDRPVTAAEVEIFKRYKQPEEKIDVAIGSMGGEQVSRDCAGIEAEIKAGKRVYLKGDVLRRTWWHSRLFTVPAVEVDINNGHIVIVVLFLLGAFAIFRVDNNPRNADFLIETESELKKVDWSSKEEVIGSTKVVILISAAFLIFMFVLDTVYLTIVRTIKSIFFGA